MEKPDELTRIRPSALVTISCEVSPALVVALVFVAGSGALDLPDSAAADPVHRYPERAAMVPAVVAILKICQFLFAVILRPPCGLRFHCNLCF